MAFKLVFLLSSTILVASIMLAYINLKEPTYYLKNMNSEQNEIQLSSPTHVLTKEGKLSMAGWSKNYENFQFSPSRINPSTSYLSFFNKLRYKKWEAFVLHHKDFILGTGIFDVSYLGGYMFHFADLTSEKKEIYAYEGLSMINKPFLADQCYHDCKIAEYKKDEISYTQMKMSKMSNQYLNMTYVSKDLNITLDLALNAKDFDSMVTLTPISQDSTVFYWNIKTYTIKAKGKILINGKSYNADDLLLAYDSGRGAWPLQSGWIWVSANGKTQNNENIGLNMGHGFNHPEASRHTEDSFFIDGKIFKLAAVETKKINPDDVWGQWTFVSEFTDQIKNKCNITFIPKKNVGNVGSGFLPHKFHVRYGLYSGECTESSGKVHKFSVWGILEDKLSLW
jgi:hypothetical protein